ncbi:RadC family protein [Muricomes intestini]|jgi:DNA repair protein RadC|uniref:RadC family protein n=1 Tax=Muricomes intestini TaxID=1796634 RepID=UPI002FE1C33C
MKNNIRIKEIQEEERPYEKCMRFGASNLTDIELLAVLLRTGTRGENSLQLAEKLLHPVFSQEGILNIHKWTLEQLLQVKGIGKVKAVQILCLSELSKRLSKATAQPGLSFTTPSTIAKYYMEDMRHGSHESMKLLLLNTKTRLIGETDISKGTINSAVVSPRELFVEALQKNAVSIILLHNHPSGDPSPSKEDVLITRRIRDAGQLIGVELLDHIIIGNNCYTSMKEKGLLF